MSSSSKGLNDIVQFLANLPDIKINLQNETGRTALHYACTKGYQKCVQLLCEQGANVNIQDSCKQTSLMRAVMRGNLEIIQLLLQYEADLTILDVEKKDVFALAQEEGQQNVFNFLTEFCQKNPDYTSKKELD